MKPWQSFWKLKQRPAALYTAGILFFLLSALFACCAGSSGLSPAEFLQGLSEGTDSIFGKIIYLVRLPRLFATVICGAALAVSGCVIQSALANPLASPSTVGVGSGAALAVTVCSAFGLMGGFVVTLSAFFGAFAAVSAVSIISAKLSDTKGTVILVGVALGAFFGAISDAIVQVSPEIAIYRNDFKIGDFSFLSTARILPAAIMIFLALAALLFLSVSMDVLSLGDENATGLGLNTKAFRTTLLLLSAVLAGCAVSLCGLLSFVGLMVPHTIKRLWRGIKTLHLILLCALYGAGFVTFCDTLSRTVFAPHEIPVGIFMAFLGAPFFLYLILSRKGDKRI